MSRSSAPRTHPLAPLALFFTLNGAVLASWLVRIPAAKDQVGASATTLGFALLCMSVGALIAMALAGTLCVRFGTSRVLVVTAFAVCVGVVLPSSAHSPVQLGVALFAYGAVNGTHEVSLNSAAAEYETSSNRSIMSPLHGLWSFGGLIGAVIGGLAAGFGLFAHLLGVGVVAAVVTAALTPAILRQRIHQPISPDGAAHPSASAPGPRPRRAVSLVVILFGVIALSTAYGEGAISDWGALHLRENLGTSASVAAYGFAAYSIAIAAARLLGGRLIDLLGRVRVLSGGAVLAAVGILVAAWASSVPIALAGYIAVGLGLANVFPIAIARAGALGGPKAVGAASMLGYTGLLAGPPMIGFLADQIGLPGALSTVPVLACLAGALGVALRRHMRDPATAPDRANSGRDQVETESSTGS